MKITQISLLEPKTSESILNTLLTLKNNGKGEKTVTTYGYKLNQLARETDLNDPQKVKTYIGNLKLANSSKNKFAIAYDHYCRINQIEWQKPYFKVDENVPLIPSTQNVQAIINNASKGYATIFTILAETGCAPEELHKVTQNDIDTEKGIIRIKGVKGHASGNYKLKHQTRIMLAQYLEKHPKEQLFPTGHAQSQAWTKYKKRTAEKLCKPELLKIQLRNLRNYSASEYYKHLPVRDVIAVMRHLRHKKLETTMHYIRAIDTDFEEDEQYTCRFAETPEEAMKLIESGFTKIDEFDGKHLYKKRK